MALRSQLRNGAKLRRVHEFLGPHKRKNRDSFASDGLDRSNALDRFSAPCYASASYSVSYGLQTFQYFRYSEFSYLPSCSKYTTLTFSSEKIFSSTLQVFCELFTTLQCNPSCHLIANSRSLTLVRLFVSFFVQTKLQKHVYIIPHTCLHTSAI